MSLDRLSIVGLEVWARMGCTAAERAFPQRLELDVDLFLALARAGERDDLRFSVDYAAVAALVKSVVEGAEWRLAEAAAERAAAAVLKGFPVPRVAVRLRKRALAGISHAEVAIERQCRERRAGRRGKM